jgi:hypothetical protein
MDFYNRIVPLLVSGLFLKTIDTGLLVHRCLPAVVSADGAD